MGSGRGLQSKSWKRKIAKSPSPTHGVGLGDQFLTKGENKVTYKIFRLQMGSVDGWLKIENGYHKFVQNRSDAKKFRSSKKAYAVARELNAQATGCAYGVYKVLYI